MILCVTPNPAIDRTLELPQIVLGAVLRAKHAHIAAGGKGLNVARVARTLGQPVICAGFLGGDSGRLVARLAEYEQLPGEWTWIDGETRTCTILVDQAGHDATVINEVGPHVAPADWLRLTAQVARAASDAAAVCLSGSLPPGSVPGDYGALVRTLRVAGRPIWIDTSGAALAAAIEAGGASIKVNADEAAALVGAPLGRPDTALAAARELQRRTGAAVVLTLGGAGAVLANEQGSWHAQPPAIRVVSSVGSGDAFLAALVVALVRGQAAPAALCQAVAAGAANALSVGGGQIDTAIYQQLLAGSVCEQLD